MQNRITLQYCKILQIMLNFSMRNILLCVIGITPQIITETIYALYKRTPPVFVDELVVITTTKGAEIIDQTIIKKNILKKLIKDYNLPEIKFPPENIIIINSDNEELSDIRTTRDNESTGNIITEVVRKLTDESKIALHCSIAGGRKTMGYYLGSSFQIYGRKQDRLYHVLVSEEFENNPQFFYPPPTPQKLKIRDREGNLIEISTDDAKIEIAELPFIRLREFVDLGDRNFEELIMTTQQEIDLAVKLPALVFNYREKKVQIGNQPLKFSPKLWDIYFSFALNKKKCPYKTKITCKDCYECFLPMKSDQNTKGLLEMLKLDESSLRSIISKVKSEIKHQIQDREILNYYWIESRRKYGDTRYGILLDKSKIIINYQDEYKL